MTDYPHNLAMVAPAALWPSLSAMLDGLGWVLGQGAPLSADGAEPATHRGIHARATQDWVDVATGVRTPEVEGFTLEQIQGAVAMVQTNVMAWPDNAMNGWLEFIDLQPVTHAE